jgi:hypothetical protein
MSEFGWSFIESKLYSDKIASGCVKFTIFVVPSTKYRYIPTTSDSEEWKLLFEKNGIQMHGFE